ncbi:MAG: hypothetical protein LBQ19_06760, partial [Synergistaceae bacterium]|nr:hypothetical protein [Synergistaceae bacterium]
MSGKKFLAGLTAFLAVMLMTTAAMAAPSLKYESEYDRDRFNVNNNTLIMVSGETVDTTITVTSGDDWPSGADDLYEITIQRKSESYQGHSYNLENLLITLHDNIDTRISSIDVRGTAGSVETENFTIFGYGATGYIPGTTGTEIASRDLILKIVSADSYYAAISPATIEIQENHSGTTSADVKVYCESYASGSKEITDVTDGFRILSMSIEPGTWNDLTLTASPADRQIGVSGRPSAIGVTESFTLEINASSGDLTVPFIVRTTTGRPWDGEITNIEISQDMYSVPVGVRFMKTIAFTTTPAVDSLSDVGYSAALSQSQWNNLQLEVDPAYNFV